MDGSKGKKIEIVEAAEESAFPGVRLKTVKIHSDNENQVSIILESVYFLN